MIFSSEATFSNPEPPFAFYFRKLYFLFFKPESECYHMALVFRTPLLLIVEFFTVRANQSFVF